MSSISIYHQYTSPQADVGSTQLVQPSNWNSVHLASATLLDAIGVSSGGNTSGNTGTIYGSYILQGGNNITLSQITGASIATVIISAANETLTQPPIATAVKSVASALSTGTITRFAPEDHAHAGVAQVQISGNTSNSSSPVIGSVVFAGGNNITLSQVTAAGAATITISAANETQTVPPIATAVKSVASALSTGTITRFAPEDHAHAGIAQVQISGNTSNTSNIVIGSVVLAGGNNITLSQVSAAGAATISISAANETQTVPPIATAVKSVQSALSTGTVTRFAPEDHAHAGIAQVQISGNTSNTSNIVLGSLVLAGGNNITLSQVSAAGAATISISAANETQTVAPIATAVKSVQAALSTGTITRFAPEDHAHAGIAQVQISGNTSNTSNVVLGSLVLAGGNNITLSQVSAASGATISISAANETQTVPPIGTAVKAVQTAGSTGTITRFAPEDHAHAGVPTVSAVGNTSGNTTQGNLSLVLAGGPNITLSGATAAGIMTLSVSAAAAGGGGVIATSVESVQSASSVGTVTRYAPEDHRHAGVNNVQISGNTSNTSNVVLGSVVLAGGNNITLSQVSGAGAATITISGPNNVAVAPTITYFKVIPYGINTGTGAQTHASMSMRTLWVFPLHPTNDVFPGNMSVNTVVLHYQNSHTNATASTDAQSSTVWFGLYTMVNATQLSRCCSGSVTWGTGAANANISSLYHGNRWMTFHSSNFDAQPTLSNTSYWGALLFSSAGTSIASGSGGAVAVRQGWGSWTQSQSMHSGLFFVASSSGVSYPKQNPFHGVHSATQAAPPASLAMSDMAYTGTNWEWMIPDVRLMASGAAGILGII